MDPGTTAPGLMLLNLEQIAMPTALRVLPAFLAAFGHFVVTDDVRAGALRMAIAS